MPKLRWWALALVAAACVRPAPGPWRAPPAPGEPITLQAEDEGALWRALGAAHAARDARAMDQARRLMDGTLREIEGRSGHTLDGFSAALGLREKTARQLGYLKPESVGALLAYTEGVNSAWPERSRPWTPEDSLLVVHLLAWTWAQGPEVELAAMASRGLLTADEVDSLTRLDARAPRAEDGWRSVRDTPLGPISASFGAFLARTRPGPAPVGEAWASASGGLGLRWEQPAGLPVRLTPARLRVGDDTREGLSLPGVPWLLAAERGALRWSLVPLGADTVDVALLARHGAAGVTVGEARQALLTGEVPALGAAEPIGWARSSLGPVITGIEAENVATLRWAALEIADQTPDLLDALWRAPSAAALFTTDFPNTALPAAVVVHEAGVGAGFVIPASLPRRRGLSGRLPYLASNVDYGWHGWLDRLPGGESVPRLGFVGVSSEWSLAPAMNAELFDPEALRAVERRAAGTSSGRWPAWAEALAVRVALAEPSTPTGRLAREEVVQAGPGAEAVLTALVAQGADARAPARLPAELRAAWADARRADARWAPAELGPALDALSWPVVPAPSATRALSGAAGAWAIRTPWTDQPTR